MKEIESYKEKIFEEIKHIDKEGNEYWEARELQELLEYKEWRWFANVIEKSQIACSQSNNNINHHFGVYSKIVKAGATSKAILDYKLSRYACYLIVQNANPKLKNVALGQTYFAIQTRKMELTEEQYNNLTEDEKRLYRRRQTKDGNKSLYKVAVTKGVKNFDKFTNAVGAYFLTIYSDSKGNIQYFEPEEILFRPNDMWDEAGKDKNKVKQLVIK